MVRIRVYIAWSGKVSGLYFLSACCIRSSTCEISELDSVPRASVSGRLTCLLLGPNVIVLAPRVVSHVFFREFLFRENDIPARLSLKRLEGGHLGLLRRSCQDGP